MTSPLANRISSGVAWTAVGKATAQGGTFVTGIVLARLLPPSDFGLLAMVTVITGFVAIFSDFGFSQSLIQAETLDQDDASTVFWMNTVFGLLIAAMLVAGAPLLADFYHQPVLCDVTRISALNFVVGPAGSVPTALLTREMRFRGLAVVEVAAFVGSATLGVTGAAIGWGVWALVAQTLARSALTSVGTWIALRWVPTFAFQLSALRRFSRFSLNLTGFSFINYWARQLDDLLIGRVMGDVALGNYARAYSTMMLPVQEVSGTLSRVMFPALAGIQGDKKQVSAIYLSTIGLIATLTFPIMGIIGTAAGPLILTLYGPNWEPAIPIVQVLAVVGAFQSIGTTVGWLYLAVGRTDVMFRWGAFASFFLMVAIVIGVSLGNVVTVAYAYAVCVAVLSYPQFAIPGALVGIRPRQILSAVAAPTVFALVASAASLAVRVLLTDSLHIAPVQLAIQSTTLGLVYSGLMLTFRPPQYQLLVRHFRERRAAKRGGPSSAP